ncbi:ATP-binding cassette domain-containing protein [Sphingomonas canadensis]|uniref:ATP-binding cassette domain-containing protein n=1 Tax=Sphingomonas canadensis TaxID=1219257 RepID=A0ABW3HA91_9SPHN|nr:ABC transporter ATP-binding protein [Sphingomonas canadensis]MCW3837671.1 ABC transporter ATP-binding protein/permease [Sphingomonas canadensis]
MSRRTMIVKLLSASRALFGAVADYSGWRGVRAGALVAGGAILDGAGLLLLVPILGVVVEGGNGRVGRMLAGFGLETPVAQLGLLVAVFVALGMLRAVVQFARDMALARLQTGFIEAERVRAVAALARAPWSSVAAMRHARITNLVTTEIQRLGTASFFMVQGIVSVAMLVIQLGIAISLAPALAGAAIALLGLGAILFVSAQGRVHDLGKGMVRAGQALMASTASFLAGLKTAAAQNEQAGFVDEFASIQREIRGRQLDFQARQAGGRRSFAILSSLLGGMVVLIGYGWLAVPPAVLITLVLIFARMSGPALQLYQSGQNFVFALPAFESVRALEAELLAAGQKDTVAPVPPPPGPIVLSGVRYLHPGGRGLRSASLTIAPGEFVGIAGPSGVGKTTMVDLIVGLLDPQQGTLTVGGVPLDPARRAGWADAIAYVSQEGFLFHDTLRRNLAWGNSADEAEMAAALALTGADGLVARMEQGLDTVVGERGAMLSGGERQRIGLARALLRRPRLLVLDEAANAIDAAGEAALLDRLKALDPRPTILMISHREESLAWCDRVIRVADGVAAG